MADPVSTASGLLALAEFAFQSSKLLCQTVASFQSNQRTVGELREELQALEGVLQSLLETVTKTDADLTALKLPLLRCGKACKDFEAIIVKCTAHSGGPRTSFRDWAKLMYMGDDIVEFKAMLAGYKSTISVALGDLDMRTSTVTITILKEYKEMIGNTTSDLKEHLQRIENKLQTLSLQGVRISDEVTAEQQEMQEERDSTQQCLGICVKVSTYIDQLQPTFFENISTPSAAYQGPVTTLGGHTPARVVTADAFKACKDTLANTTTQLEERLQNVNNRLQYLSPQLPKASIEQATEKQRIEDEMDSIKQCLAICAEASRQAHKDRTNVFEDISMADDGYQVFVSTIGDLVSARRITAGDKSIQLLGKMSDESLQQLSRDLGRAAIGKAAEPQTGKGTQFEDRYGAGVRLSL